VRKNKKEKKKQLILSFFYLLKTTTKTPEQMEVKNSRLPVWVFFISESEFVFLGSDLRSEREREAQSFSYEKFRATETRSIRAEFLILTPTAL